MAPRCRRPDCWIWDTTSLGQGYDPAGDACSSVMSKSSAIVYWLVPAKPERELFRKIIRILADQLDASRFEPHLTLLVARKGGGSVRAVLRRITASPIHLRVRTINFSSK